MSRDASRRSQSNQNNNNNNNSALRNQKTREDFYKNVNNLLTAATTSIQIQKPNSQQRAPSLSKRPKHAKNDSGPPSLVAQLNRE